MDSGFLQDFSVFQRRHTKTSNGEHGGLAVEHQTPKWRGPGFDPHTGQDVVSLGKTK